MLADIAIEVRPGEFKGWWMERGGRVMNARYLDKVDPPEKIIMRSAVEGSSCGVYYRDKPPKFWTK